MDCQVIHPDDSGYSNLAVSQWPAKTASVVVSVHKLQVTGSVYIGKGIRELPFILVPVSDSYAAEPDHHLRHLTITHGISATIRTDHDSTLDFVCSAIACDDPDSIDAFLRFSSLLGSVLGDRPTSKTVSRLVLKFADLLAFSNRPTEETVRGFWAELFLISEARNPNLLLLAWHRSANDIHDFVLNNERIEVKSSGRRSRKHEFSHDQLKPTSNSVPVIASIQLQAASEPSVLGLAERLLGDVQITHANKQKLLELAIQTLGVDWMEEDDVAFDLGFARQSLRLYHATELPQIRESIPHGVSSLRYSIEIGDDILPIDLGSQHSTSPLLSACPRL